MVADESYKSNMTMSREGPLPLSDFVATLGSDPKTRGAGSDLEMYSSALSLNSVRAIFGWKIPKSKDRDEDISRRDP